MDLSKKKLYLFDLDGTLTRPKSGNKFPQTVDDREFMEGRWERLIELHGTGKKTAIVTNQGGAAWGIFEQADMHQLLARLCNYAEIDKYFVCYRDTGEKARNSDRTIKELTEPEYYDVFDRRKPGPGMLLEAMDHFCIDRRSTVMIGDREEDEKAAEAAGCAFVWEAQFFKGE